MVNENRTYQGCLLGMAAGDAMGCVLDTLSWQEIQRAYGRRGLLGYDLKNREFAAITSYTQIGAYLCNGLLLSLTRSKSDQLRYAKVALRDWTRSQLFYRDPEQSSCWVAKLPQFRGRQCRDARMLDNLRQGAFGTVDAPRNDSRAPGAITAGVAAGMYYMPGRIPTQRVGTLACDLVALTHGNPDAFLSGAVLAYTIAGILQAPELPLEEQFLQAIAVTDGQFRSQFPQSELLARQLRDGIALARAGVYAPQEGMEKLLCLDAPQCLAGAMFACLLHPEDFDSAIVTAVNHSGASAAVGAITGAILGAKLGMDGLPDFYLESLECVDTLAILGEDMACATPLLGLFEDSWDRKYNLGLPPEEIL